MKNLLALLLICLQPLFAGIPWPEENSGSKLLSFLFPAKKEEKFSFKQLPVEVKAHIFSFLNLSNLKKARLICHDWNDVIKENLPERLYKKTKLKFILEIGLNSHPAPKHLKYLEIWNCGLTDEQALTLIQNFPNIQVLSFFVYSGSDASVITLFNNLSLQSVRISSCSFSDDVIVALSKQPCLKDLNLNSDIFLTNKSIEALKSTPSLERLSLTSCKKFSDAGLIALSTCCPNLHTLNLRTYWSLTDTGLIALSHHPNLQSLNLEYDYKYTGAGIRALKNSPKLRYLFLNASWELPQSMRDAIIYLRIQKPYLRVYYSGEFL